MPKLAELEEIYSGATTSTRDRWSAVSFFDKALFAAKGAPVLYYSVALGTTAVVPGLPNDTRYTGVSAFFDHVILWSGDILKWSAAGDYSLYIPVSETAGSFVVTLLGSQVQPAVNITTEFVYVNEPTFGVTVGQFIRMFDRNSVNYYSVVAVSEPSDLTGVAAPVAQNITADGQNIYTTEYVDWVIGSHIGGSIDKKPFVVVDKSLNESFSVTLASTFTVPAVGALAVATLTSLPGYTVGQYASLSIGTAAIGKDIYQISARDIGAKTITLKRIGLGTVAGATGFVYPSGTLLLSQPFVTVNIVRSADTPIFVAAGDLLLPLFGFKVRSEDLTGRSPDGTVFPAGRQLFSVDANESGEVKLGGAGINGAILGFVELANRGYVLKSRSIQSVQFVGIAAGIFLFTTEITDEGLYGKYSYKKVGEDTLYFLGQRELYKYGGGKDLVPIAKQYTRQLYADIDQARADEIIMGHNERKDELVIIYFGLDGTQRQFIYNFVENSCTVDIWPTTIGDITAENSVTWRQDLTWLDMPNAWTTYLEDWLFYEGTGDAQRITVAAAHGRVGPPQYPILLEAGNNYSFSGDAYLSTAETIDYDFGNSAFFKYADTVELGFQIKQHLDPRPFKVYVQLGGRDSLDADIRWSAPQAIDVSGNATHPPRLNIRKSGRYLRMRIYSQQTDIQWRLSYFRLVARLGNTY